MPSKKKGGGGAKPAVSAADAKAALNLQVLQRQDPQIVRIDATTPHATLYRLENGADWKMEDVAGAFFLFTRKVAPHFGMHIMNQKAFDNYHRLILPDDHFEMEASFLMFSDDGQYYGLWFGTRTEDERKAVCQLVMDKAKASAAGTVPPVSYAAKAGAAAGAAVPSEEEASKAVVAMAATAPHSDRGEPGDPPASEQAHLASLLGQAAAGGSADGSGGGSNFERNHLQSLLTQATAKASPTQATSEPAQGGDKLAALLMNAASRQSAPGGAAVRDEQKEHMARLFGGATAAAASTPEQQTSTRPSTLLPVPPLPEAVRTEPTAQPPAGAAVVATSASSLQPNAAGPTPTSKERERGPMRAPKNMAHLLQNPGTTTKVAVAAPAGASRGPTVLDRMRGASDEGEVAGGSPRTVAASIATTAGMVEGRMTTCLTELVEMQEARAAARDQSPRMISKDELRKILLHVLANTENEALLSVIFLHYKAIFSSR